MTFSAGTCPARISSARVRSRERTSGGPSTRTDPPKLARVRASTSGLRGPRPRWPSRPRPGRSAGAGRKYAAASRGPPRAPVHRYDGGSDAAPPRRRPDPTRRRGRGRWAASTRMPASVIRSTRKVRRPAGVPATRYQMSFLDTRPHGSTVGIKPGGRARASGPVNPLRSVRAPPTNCHPPPRPACGSPVCRWPTMLRGHVAPWAPKPRVRRPVALRSTARAAGEGGGQRRGDLRPSPPAAHPTNAAPRSSASGTGPSPGSTA